MSNNYSIRQLAEKDLEEIWFYTFTEWGQEQADSYIGSFLSRFAWLTENPRIGKHRDDVKNGYYCLPEGMHLVFYIIDENGIDIIGVPHQSMDIIDHLTYGKRLGET